MKIFGNKKIKGHIKDSQNQLGLPGADVGFQVRGAHLNNFFGVFRVKNHDFTPKNHIFSNFRGGRAPGAPPWLHIPELGVIKQTC